MSPSVTVTYSSMCKPVCCQRTILSDAGSVLRLSPWLHLKSLDELLRSIISFLKNIVSLCSHHQLPSPDSRHLFPGPSEDPCLTSAFRTPSFHIPWIWQTHEVIRRLPVPYTSKARFPYGLGAQWRHSLVQPHFTTCALCVTIPKSSPSVSLLPLPWVSPFPTSTF